jgi:alkanesulfonate monooxygenase SsuD/methylene tetrahydromethanopterin reductase-like flavin-dependent oxidoreductase (luciferase family)
MTPASSVGIALPLTSRAGTTADLLEELIEEVEVAEQTGFGLCMIPEHRQGPDVSLGSPLTVAAALAARTRRINIATGVLIAAVHHPVHLAEQVTTLDHLSRGRFILGVGAGYQESDLAPFRIGLDERAGRLEDVLGGLDMLLTHPSTSFEGRTLSFPSVDLRPRPLTRPRPPIWLGAWSSNGIRRAAVVADGWIADPIRTDKEVANMAGAYRRECDRAGTVGTVIVMREAWIDEDTPQAAERCAGVIEPIYRYYRRHGAYAGAPGDGSAGGMAEMVTNRIVFGSPETCAARVAEVLDRTGADRVVLHVRHPGGPGHARTIEGLRALGQQLAQAG